MVRKKDRYGKNQNLKFHLFPRRQLNGKTKVENKACITLLLKKVKCKVKEKSI